jgi:hypothetical protein
VLPSRFFFPLDLLLARIAWRTGRLSMIFTANSHPTVPRALVFLIVLLGFSSANAATKATENSDSIVVLARLPLRGIAVEQMFLEESGGRNYLYIRRAGQPGYTVVDVTQARHPRILKQITLSKDFPRETLENLGAGLGIAGRPDTKSGNLAEPGAWQGTEEASSSDPPTQFVKLLDLSDPSRPRTLKTYAGVTSVSLDNRRNMIYLANHDGLWILYHRIDLLRQECEYESKYSEVPLMCDGY